MLFRSIDQDTANVLEQKSIDTNQSLESVLREYGIKAVDILNAKAEFLNIEPYYLGDNDIPFEILNYIPEDSARHYKIIPIGINNGVLNVGIYDPDNIEAIDALNFISSKNNITYKLFLISEEDFNRGLEMYRGLTGEVHEALTNFEKEFGDLDDDDYLELVIQKRQEILNLVS